MKRLSLIVLVNILTFCIQGCRNCFESVSSSIGESIGSYIGEEIFHPYEVESSVDSKLFAEQINSIGLIIYENPYFLWPELLDSVQRAGIEKNIIESINSFSPYLRIECSAIKDAVNENGLKYEYEKLLKDCDDEIEIDYKFINKIENLVDVDCILIVEVQDILIVPANYNYSSGETQPAYSRVNNYVYLYSSSSEKLLWEASVYEKVDYEVYKDNLARELIIPAFDRIFEKFPL